MLKTGYEDSENFSFNAILGIDECGYGCGAGDLYICGVVLPKNYRNPELKDSKLIKSPNKMAKIASELMTNPNIRYKIEVVTVEDINTRGVIKALRRGVTKLIRYFVSIGGCDSVFIDGTEKYSGSIPVVNVIKGDNTYQNIAAASIICKYVRDNYMIKLSETYKGYDLENNKGYLTPKHIAAIKSLGPRKIHRDAYVKNFV